MSVETHQSRSASPPAASHVARNHANNASDSHEHRQDQTPPQRITARPLVQRTYLHAAGDLEVYPRSLTFAMWPTEAPFKPRRGGRRGSVTTFSRKSRFSMIRKMSRIQLDVLSPAAWISLTYHHNAPEDRETILAHVNAWQERIRRRFPSMVYIRRLDWQERDVVHWHYIMWTHSACKRWNTPRVRRWLAAIWHAIADPDSEPHKRYGAKIKPVNSYRQLMSYVSGDAAKVQEGEHTDYHGRRWSSSYHLPAKPLIHAEPPYRALARLKRAARLLGTMRGASPRWRYAIGRRAYEVTLLLRDGEAARLLAIAGLEEDRAPGG